MRAPFPYHGGKSRVSHLVWAFLGNVNHYLEPFCGSAAVLLDRPSWHTRKWETLNDADGMIVNFWRAVKSDPKGVESMAHDPVFELDLHARHKWLYEQSKTLPERLREDPHYYDTKIAAWWAWGISAWIGGDWCGSERAANSKRIPFLAFRLGVHAQTDPDWAGLSKRFERVAITCGDWSRILTPTVVTKSGVQPGPYGVFLDPPYATGNQQYAAGGTGTDLSAQVRAWCLNHELGPDTRIVLAGYEGEHDELETHGWRVVPWIAAGSGYVGKGEKRAEKNQGKERLWVSPNCLSPKLDMSTPIPTVVTSSFVIRGKK